ncbi:DNA polymerase III subunit gamma/tau [Polycyclovorans algicola]|uniref:DNA polymerase III subunit gamma/tau n=1 Tax=Polycyclovorans algicola TaxID=616992 RepID=UPI0004A73A3E|nr:DNA polymerase III subunit gamma/tau [Polycyclovorans algicola]
MSYLALARKWRPRQFDDVVGQGPVVQALRHALDHDRLHPAILLTGTRGVGKTTLARILAKGLNCSEGVSGTPCGVCDSCREIDEGRAVDMLEIDAASHTGVENIREVIENAQYSPARSRYKVYLIDEVHMLSKGAFNALLKTLEEPPPHVKFILATTDPQKLPVTILSRCLQFGLRRMTVALIQAQLLQLATAENVTTETGALRAIARAADGSMRDALSLLDQTIAFASGGAVTEDAVDTLIGHVGRSALWPVLDALLADDRPGVAAQFGRLEALSPDYAALADELVAVLQRLAVVQLLPDARNEADEAELLALCERVHPEQIQVLYQIAVNGRRDLQWAPEPRLGFEMILLRMLAFQLDDAPPAAGPSSPGGSRNGSNGAGTIDHGEAAGPGPSAASSKALAAAPPPAAPQVAEPEPKPNPGPALHAAPPVEGPAVQLPDTPVSDGVLAQRWRLLVERLPVDAFVKGLARNSVLREQTATDWRLELTPSAQYLLKADRLEALQTAVADTLGAPRRLSITVAAGELDDVPAQLDAADAHARQAEAEAAVTRDPVVASFVQQFGARVRPGSIQPPASPSVH